MRVDDSDIDLISTIAFFCCLFFWDRISFDMAALSAVLLLSLSMWATGFKGRLFFILAIVSCGLGAAATFITVLSAMSLSGLDIPGKLCIVGCSFYTFHRVYQKIKDRIPLGFNL